MKSSITLFVVFLILIFSFQILPQETADQNSTEMEASFETLHQGLNSDNLGLQAGCAYMIGKLCRQMSVVALLKMLHDSSSEELRILAALSLYKIEDSRGTYAIKQAIKFDESKRVQRMCEIFYKAYIRGKSWQHIKYSSKLENCSVPVFRRIYHISNILAKFCYDKLKLEYFL